MYVNLTGAKSLGSALVKNPSLHTLILDNNQISLAGAESLGRIFANNRYTRSLTATAGTCTCFVLWEVGRKFDSGCPQRGRFLWRLSLRGNALGPAGTRGLVPTSADVELAGADTKAARSSGLSSLDLHGNHIGDEGCLAVASMLQSPLLSSLTQLGLSTFLDTTRSARLMVLTANLSLEHNRVLRGQVAMESRTRERKCSLRRFRHQLRAS
eukprot:COSAG02_NODE_3311_length_6956_cov_3.255359_5_plen_212_part_00